MKIWLFASPLLLAACATPVTHPTRSNEQMRADVARCSDVGHGQFPLDPVAAMYKAYDCLDAMGYQRDRSGLAGFIEENFAGRRPPPRPTICQVPCPGGLRRR